MKRISAFLLTFLFLISNSGMAVNGHWCGGKLASVKFLSDEEHGCKCGKSPMKANCCKEVKVSLKANKELANAGNFSLKISFPEQIFLFSNPFSVSQNHQDAPVTSDFYHPPLFKPKIPIFLLDKVFLI